MIFGDNQTKHFYALKSSDTATVKQNGDNLRVIFKDSNSNAIGTTDMINTRHILSAKITEVKPTYFRTWTVAAPSAVVADTTYHIYFYLENMTGFGMQDRWDRVASYTAKTDDDVAAVMTALKNDLDSKLNGAGPIKGDFTVTSGSSNSIVVAENPNGPSFKGGLSELDIRMHTTPYVYNVTMSTFDGTNAWGGQKEIHGVEAAANGTYISAADKVRAMEFYFLRNRGDLYDLSKDFYTSILNNTNMEYNTNHYYYTLDVHYAFSDGLGFTYYSEKDLTIAMNNSSHAIPSKLTTLLGNLEPITDRVTALENA